MSTILDEIVTENLKHNCTLVKGNESYSFHPNNYGDDEITVFHITSTKGEQIKLTLEQAAELYKEKLDEDFGDGEVIYYAPLGG